MRIHDSLIGSVLLLLSLTVLWSLRDFPEPIGQPYGAALFPGLIAGGLAVCSMLLIVQGRCSQQPCFTTNDGLRSPRHRVGFVLVLGTLLFYILCAEALGFLICGAFMTMVLLWAFSVRLRWIVPIGIAATLIIHTAFYKFLKVPLPWGVLENWAW